MKVKDIKEEDIDVNMEQKPGAGDILQTNKYIRRCKHSFSDRMLHPAIFVSLKLHHPPPAPGYPPNLAFLQTMKLD